MMAARARLVCGSLFLCLLGAATAAAAPPAAPSAAQAIAPPSVIYGELFERVQLERVYPDSKTFVDALPVREPATILAEYQEARGKAGFDLRKFVAARFKPPEGAGSEYHTPPGREVGEHIDALWLVLERKPDDQRPWTSRLALPHPYIVPGGRFNEIYYWDSYFTMLGLEESGLHDRTVSMVDNFAWLIDQYGHVPNGNRSYYLSRSQPPFFAAMVELLAERDGASAYRKYLAQLRAEYAFWMDGAEGLAPGAAHRRVVRLEGGLLNRYWDDRDTPRDESYREDLETARASGRDPREVYRNLRAAAESGWDFSSRWFADGRTLATIRTTELIPVDLNSLLYQLELTIAKGCDAAADTACKKDMSTRAAMRKAAMIRYLWNESAGAFTDYDWKARKAGTQVTAATMYPLYFEVANADQARTVAATLRSQLLQPHGVATTLSQSGEQWDAPNGWAPLQWITIRGLQHYGEGPLAAVIAQRWVAKNLEVYRKTGKLVEKYDVSGAAAAKGGEYPLQDGFGWTNGVLRKLLAMYPALASNARYTP